MKRLMFVLGLLAGGCAWPVEHTETPPPAGMEDAQAKAVDLIWHTVYGMTTDAPPIAWRYGDTCNGAEHQWKSLNVTDYCVLGEYHPDYVEMEYWEGALMSDTCLAHELGHARQWHLNGDLDRDHTDGPFLGSHYCTGEDQPNSLVYKAIQMLKEAGL